MYFYGMKRLVPVILFAAVLCSCSKKTSLVNNTSVLTAELRTQSNDAVRVSNELDAAFNDVDSILENHADVCNGTFAINTADTPNVMAITYKGNTCDALSSRSGYITIDYTPGSSWTTAGDSVTVNLSNLLITRLSDNKNFQFNGTLTYYNTSGGALAGLSAGSVSPVVHTIAGFNVNVTYDDGTLSRWQFTRRRTYTYNQGIVISTVGTDSAGTVANVADWGSNRYGNSMILVPTTPLLISQSCGWRTTGGQATLSNPSGTSTLSFGLDSTGKATGCPLPGIPFYYKMAWTADGENPYTALLPY
jgi:hypothetical protein